MTVLDCAAGKDVDVDPRRVALGRGVRRSAPRRLLLSALLALPALGLAPHPASAEQTCADPSAQTTFAAHVVQPRVAVGRYAQITVYDANGSLDRSGDFDRAQPATVTLDDPAAAAVADGGHDPAIVPARAGTVGATVAWTETSYQNGLQCSKSQHVSFEAIAGTTPPLTVFGNETGNFERSAMGAGLKACDRILMAVVPVTWAFHWTTDGSVPTRQSHTLRWSSPDPCAVRGTITGPRRVRNATFSLDAGQLAETLKVRVAPLFKSGVVRGWWELTAGGSAYRNVRFKWVFGHGFRRIGSRRIPITGIKTEHDRGPCPGVACSTWTIPRPGI